MTTSKLPSLIDIRSISKGLGERSCLLASMLFHGHCCLPLGTGFSNVLSLHGHDKLLTLGAFLTQGKASSIPTIFSWDDSISPDSFLPSILLLVVIIVAVVIVVVAVILVVVVVE
ncbi:hypothetical protein Tco_0107877, partial [Tanacetum coccineum]